MIAHDLYKCIGYVRAANFTVPLQSTIYGGTWNGSNFKSASSDTVDYRVQL